MIACFMRSGRAAIGEVAISVEPALAAVDPEREEDARDAAGHEFAHREHVGAHAQRRQDFEHVIMLGLRDLEPLAGEECRASPSAMAGSPRWRLNIRYISWRVATPSKTLRMVGEVCIGGSCWPGRTEARAIRLISSSLQSFITPPRRPPLRSGGSRAAERGRSFTLDAPAGHAAAPHCHFIFPFSLFDLLLAAASPASGPPYGGLAGAPPPAGRRVCEPHQELAVRAFRSSFQSSARGRNRAYRALASAAMARTRSA